MIQLMHGDCLKLMQKIPDGSVAMILCDLPYGTTCNKWDSVIPFADLWSAYYRIAKKQAALVFTAAQPFTSALIMSNVKRFRYSWVWEKPQGTNPLNAKHQPMRVHEDIIVFGGKTYNAQMTEGKPYKGASWTSAMSPNFRDGIVSRHRDNPEGTRYPRTVLRFPNVRGGEHPTQKPVALMEYLIRTYTNPRDVVLDNCMGSGTTGVAAKKTGRSFIGIEQDAAYFAIAQRRIAEAETAHAMPVSGSPSTT